MSLTENLIQEFELESAVTRRVLEDVPGDRLTWKPYPGSLSIGELAVLVARESGILGPTALTGGIDSGTDVCVRQPNDLAEILDMHDAGVESVVNGLRQLGDSGLERNWSATIRGARSSANVRKVIRHHRELLLVYLALLDAPAPHLPTLLAQVADLSRLSQSL